MASEVNVVSLEDFIERVGPTLRGMFPGRFKKSDPEAGQAEYELWHGRLCFHSLEKVKMVFQDWRSTMGTKKPSPSDIQRKLEPKLPGMPYQESVGGKADTEAWEREHAEMVEYMDGVDFIDKTLVKADLLASNSDLEWMSDADADGWKWRPLIYCEMKRREGETSGKLQEA